MARNRSAARLVRVAALLTGKSQPEARHLQACLGGNAGLTGQEPDPAKGGIPVDDKPNPFQDGTDDPDVCLRGPWLDNVASMHTGDDLPARRLLDRVRGSGSASPA